MPSFSELLLCYGLCFGLMNKVDFIRGKSSFLDRMLNCSYCTGFHAGWIGYSAAQLVKGVVPASMPEAVAIVGTAAMWGFASSVFCYGADTVLTLAESWVRKSD